MINGIEWKDQFLNKTIDVIVSETEEGIQVLVAGGDKSHIGAVCIMDPDGNRATHCFRSHRDDVVAQKWAAELYKKTKKAVVVSAGIHYDHISSEEIKQILEKTDALLKNVLERI